MPESYISIEKKLNGSFQLFSNCFFDFSLSTEYNELSDISKSALRPKDSIFNILSWFLPLR